MAIQYPVTIESCSHPCAHTFNLDSMLWHIRLAGKGDDKAVDKHANETIQLQRSVPRSYSDAGRKAVYCCRVAAHRTSRGGSVHLSHLRARRHLPASGHCHHSSPHHRHSQASSPTAHLAGAHHIKMGASSSHSLSFLRPSRLTQQQLLPLKSSHRLNASELAIRVNLGWWVGCAISLLLR